MPVYTAAGGGRGVIVVEARKGPNGASPGTTLNPSDPSQRPSVEIQADLPLGNGSVEECDLAGNGNEGGGIPAIVPPGFGPDPSITHALRDFACRFQPPIVATKKNSFDLQLACTLDASGNIRFLSPVSDNTVLWQYCDAISSEAVFRPGTTTLTVRVNDSRGTPGATAQIRVKVPTPTPTPHA